MHGAPQMAAAAPHAADVAMKERADLPHFSFEEVGA